METNENSLDMLERLLHDEIRPHSTLGLPSEPQVMRTKRMGHRKAQSISYLVPGGKQATVVNGNSNHKRNSSLSGLSDGGDFKVPALNQQPYQLPAHPLSGHRRFHSVGGVDNQNANLTYQFPSSQSAPHEPSNLPFQPPFGNSNLSYTFPGISNGHQKSLSGTSEMFNEFVVMNLEKDDNIVQQRPMTRLHPLMQDSHYPSNDQGYDDLRSGYPDDLHSGYPDDSQAGYIPAPANEELYFNDETNHNEEEFGFGGGNYNFNQESDFNQVVTKCSWTDCHREMHTQDALVNHILQDHVGTGKASYTCEWEGCARLQKPFSKRHKIQNHIRIHTGERPFACPIADCGKKFSRQDGLNTHIKTHSSVKPYVCSFSNCGKAYFHSRSLRKHERTHIDSPNGQSFTDSPSSGHNYAATQEQESQFGIYGANSYIPSYQQQEYTQQEYTPQPEYNQQTDFQSDYKPGYTPHEFALPQEEQYGLMELASLSSANPIIGMDHKDPPVGVEEGQPWAGFVEG